MGILFVAFAGGVAGYVEALFMKVFDISNAMFVIARVPYLSGRLFANREGVTAFDELDATCSRLIMRWSNENVNVVWHYDKGVQLEPSLVSISEETGDEEFGICGSLKMAMLSIC